MNAKTATRKIAQITDAEIAEYMSTISTLQARLDRQVRAQNASEAREDAKGAEHYQRRADAIRAEIEKLQDEIRPLRDMAHLNGWTRYVLVPGGHVHRWEGCSTLRMSTTTFWLTDYSGADEAELVEDAGEAACTVCFPSAPVDRPTRIPVLVKEREEREAEAREKAAKLAQKHQAAVLDEAGRVVYKTQRAAENDLGQEIGTMVYFASYVPTWIDPFDGHETPNTETQAEYLARVARHREEHRRKAQRIVELLKLRGVETEPLVAKKLAAKTKEALKGGHVILPADLGL